MLVALFVTGLFIGKLCDNKSAKLFACIGAVLYAGGWVLAGFFSSIGMMFVCVSLIAGVGDGMLYSNMMSLAAKWWPDRKGMAVGITLAGCNVIPLVFSPISNALCENFGASRALTLCGLIYAVIFAVAMLCVRDVPSPDWKPEGWDPSAQRTEFVAKKEYSRKEMLLTSVFWVMVVVYCGTQCSGQLIISSASSIGIAMVGMTTAQGALMSSFNSVGNIVGRVCWGAISDKIGRYNSLYCILGISIVVMLVTPQVSSVGAFIPMMVLNGICFAGNMVLFPPMLGDRFGLKSQTANMTCLYGGTCLAGFIGPLLGSVAYDYFGDYSIAFIGSAIISAVCVVVLFFLSRMRLPSDRNPADTTAENA